LYAALAVATIGSAYFYFRRNPDDEERLKKRERTDEEEMKQKARESAEAVKLRARDTVEEGRQKYDDVKVCSTGDV
jgi:hypothetical protein